MDLWINICKRLQDNSTEIFNSSYYLSNSTLLPVSEVDSPESEINKWFALMLLILVPHFWPGGNLHKGPG